MGNGLPKPSDIDLSRLSGSTRSAIDIVRAAGEEVSDLAIAILQRVDDGELTINQAVKLIIEMSKRPNA